MNCLILGASGKIGKVLLKNLIAMPSDLVLGVQFNSNSSFLDELGLNSTQETWPLEFDLNNKKIIAFKVDFNNTTDLHEFSNYIKNRFNEVDIIINLLSTFVESSIDTEESIIKNIIDTNFLNQSLFFKDIHKILSKTFIVEFLDYSIFEPYLNKYFWYSVSRYGMFGFMKTFEKYLKKNNYKTKFLYVFPKIIKGEKDIEELSKIVINAIVSRSDGEIIF